MQYLKRPFPNAFPLCLSSQIQFPFDRKAEMFTDSHSYVKSDKVYNRETFPFVKLFTSDNETYYFLISAIGENCHVIIETQY